MTATRNFLVLADLPASVRNEIARITAISSGLRSTPEAAFLAAHDVAINNQIIIEDDDGYVVYARGTTLPTSKTGFKKGALFVKTDAGASTNGLYLNYGDETSAAWDLIDSATGSVADGAVTVAKLAATLDLSSKTITLPANCVTAAMLAATLDLASIQLTSLRIETGTPVNAVAASGTFTLAGNVTDEETVTVGGKTYTFQSAIGAATAATGNLNVDGLPNDLDTITMDGVVYRWRTSFSEVAATGRLTFTGVSVDTQQVVIGSKTYTTVTALTEVAATGTLTLSANATDGNSVTIGSTKYTFKETLGVAYDVLIGASASDTIDNLIAAINGAAGEGSTYGTGTVAHTSVTAAAGVGDTMDVTASAVGTAGNAIATTELSAVCSWGGGTLSGGVDAVVNEVVVGGTAEASIDNLVAAINGAAGEGTTYATGTTASTQVTAVKTDTDKLDVTAITAGYAGNSIATTETQTNASWGAATLTGGNDADAANDVLIGGDAETCIDNLVLANTAGAGEGTNYGAGTTAHTTIILSKADAANATATAANTGDAGNLLATTESSANITWDAATLSGGEGDEAANDVLIGATASDSLDNLIAAINKAAGEGTTYGSGTTANANVTAAAGAGDTMDVTAKVKGVAGNSIESTEVSAQGSWGGATLSGGVDGTVGIQWEVLVDSSYLYVAIAANTIADANWRRVALGSAF